MPQGNAKLLMGPSPRAPVVSRPLLGLLGPRIREQMLTEGEVSKPGSYSQVEPQQHLPSTSACFRSLWESSLDLSGPALCSFSTMAALTQEEENEPQKHKECNTCKEQLESGFYTPQNGSSSSLLVSLSFHVSNHLTMIHIKIVAPILNLIGRRDKKINKIYLVFILCLAVFQVFCSQ